MTTHDLSVYVSLLATNIIKHMMPTPPRFSRTLAFCCFASFTVAFVKEQRTQKCTRSPLKENHLGNFSGFEEKLSRPVVGTKTLQKPGKTISTTEIFPLWPPFFSAKVPHWSRAVYALFLPSFGASGLKSGRLKNALGISKT